MISVSIFINGKPIFTRTAIRMTKIKKALVKNLYSYKVDDGSNIIHDQDEGAVELAIKMLKTIKEQK